jgi:hypothetical protein
MRVTFLVEILVRSPTIADDCSAWFDPVVYYGHQSVGKSIWNWNEERYTRISLDLAEYPLPHNEVAPIIFPSTKLTLINLDDLVRTADFLSAYLQVDKHGLSTELSPVGDGSKTEPMLLFDTCCRFTPHDVVG